MLITNAILTAYCACTICCGPNTTGLTANGKPPKQGVTVAASRLIPLNTKINIKGMGERVVTDRMHRKYDTHYRVDIYFNKHSDAKEFGIKTNTITILP